MAVRVLAVVFLVPDTIRDFSILFWTFRILYWESQGPISSSILADIYLS